MLAQRKGILVLVFIFIISVVSINIAYLVLNRNTSAVTLECPKLPPPPLPKIIEVVKQANCPPAAPPVSSTSPSVISPSSSHQQKKNNNSYKKPYLVSIMTVCEARTARKSMRQWLRSIETPQLVTDLYDYKFFVETERYVNDQVNIPMYCLTELKQEQEEFGDIVFLDLKKEEQGWFKLSHKVERMLQYVNEHFIDQYKYIVKADDDTLVLLDALHENIREKEKEFLQYSRDWGYAQYQGKSDTDELAFLLKHFPLYAGFRYNNNWVMLEGNWQNVPYHSDSGLQQYTKYMSGGMYVLSNSIVRALGTTSRIVPLAKWTMEDANVGFWITSLKAVWLHIPNIVTHDAANCHEGRMVVYHPIKNPQIMAEAYECVLKQKWERLCELTLAVNMDRGYHDTVRT